MSSLNKPEEPGNGSARELPDPVLCRVHPTALNKLYECKVESPCICTFAMPFGRTFFCQHP
jgi:hypothetical protein